MITRIQFSGPMRYRTRIATAVCRSAIEVRRRRKRAGPKLPGWNWAVEFSTQVLKTHLEAAFDLNDVNEFRCYLDCVVLNSSSLSQVDITHLSGETIKGRWFVPKSVPPRGRMLYFHGGGYSLYPKSHTNLIALVTLAAKSRTFALDYRLAPEYRFPAQLEDALNAYRWLLDDSADTSDLVIAGDSAGGNLALALLLSLRDLQLPMPALVVALSPPTDFVAPAEGAAECTSLVKNEDFDWITRPMLLQWSAWFCDFDQQRDPLVSPVYADLRNLPPIYIQAGGAEILYDSIHAFADRAREQGAQVVLETWPEMNHEFQMFGHLVPQSVEALERLGEVIDARLRSFAQTTIP